MENTQQHATEFLTLKASATGWPGAEPPLPVEYPVGAAERGTVD